MTKMNPRNERIKHEYFSYLEEAKRMSPDSVDDAAAAIAQFEETTRQKDFAAFRIEQAKRFKRHLAEARSKQTGRPLAKSTIHSRLNAVKAFFFWLAGQPGYKSKISYSDCDYFNPSANDSRIASARREARTPTIEQIRHVLETMPAGSLIEQRDRAIIAFTLLTGARDNAVASFNIGHVDLERRTVFQDGSTVRTKNRKTFTTSFFPVGDDIEQIVCAWIEALQRECLFGPDDPLFPATQIGLNQRGEFQPDGFRREHWASADAIRKIFKTAFEAAGLPYFNPHSFRKTLALLGQKICRTPEELKAWSQNLGHENMLTTLTSYGTIDPHRQRELISRISAGSSVEFSTAGPPTPEQIEWVLSHVSQRLKTS